MFRYNSTHYRKLLLGIFLFAVFPQAMRADSPQPANSLPETNAAPAAPPAAAATDPDAELNRLIRLYSTQRIVSLDAQETCTFKLKSGAERAIRLVSVAEHRDSVVDLVRRAEVRIEIDGKPLDLVCEPYVMPIETAGLRLIVDSTAGWKNIPKQVQLSIWDAADKIVDAKRFVYPLHKYRMFSHGTQAYNEAVHLGAGDDDPSGQRFYHDYGFDQGGFEGGESVLSAVEGEIVYFWPSRENICSVVVQDQNGFEWEHCHLKSFEPEIVLKKHVMPGEKLGTLGKTGPSGNFSHLHLGTYCSPKDASINSSDPDHPNRRLNLYPWLVAAYQAQHPKGLAAVARPHHIVLTGEKVVFDGTHSLAWGGGRIVAWRWVFPDGQTVDRATAEKTFDQPGATVAALWVKDDRGAEDVDFCQVKVFSKADPEKNMPHLYMTYTPTQDIRPDQPVNFRFWLQGNGGGPIAVEFDDGFKLENYQPYSEFQHGFKTSGIHIVTAQCQAGGKRIMQKLKVVVEVK
jgi:hypothetical protein